MSCRFIFKTTKNVRLIKEDSNGYWDKSFLEAKTICLFIFNNFGSQFSYFGKKAKRILGLGQER